MTSVGSTALSESLLDEYDYGERLEEEGAGQKTSEEADGRRWEQLLIFVVLNVCSQMAWIQYTTVPSECAAAFGVPLSAVTALATTFPAVYVFGSILAARAMRRGSLKGTLRESASWMLLGSALKLFGAALAFRQKQLGYALTLLGQIFVGLGQPHLLNSPAALATDWFPFSERDLAATLGLLGSILGQVIGEALCPVVVAAARKNLQSSTTEAIFLLSLFVAAPTVLVSIWTFFRFQNRFKLQPLTSAELVAQQRGAFVEVKHTSLLRQWYRALKEDHDFFILWLAFCVGISVFNSILALAAQWLALCGYNDGVAGLVTAVFVVVGIPAAGIVGAILDATRAYRPVLKGLALLSFLGTLSLVLAARPHDTLFLYLASGLAGGALIAASAAIMEAAVECTHPKAPELSTGLLFCGGNLLTVAVTYVIDALLRAQQGQCLPLDAIFSQHQSAPVALFLLGSFVLCSTLLIVYKGPYRRLEAEKKQQKIILERQQQRQRGPSLVRITI